MAGAARGDQTGARGPRGAQGAAAAGTPGGRRLAVRGADLPDERRGHAGSPRDTNGLHLAQRLQVHRGLLSLGGHRRQPRHLLPGDADFSLCLCLSVCLPVCLSVCLCLSLENRTPGVRRHVLRRRALHRQHGRCPPRTNYYAFAIIP